MKQTLPSIVELVSRILLSAIFLISTVGKMTAYAATQRYMELQGVADWLLPVVVAAEIILPLMVILGWHTRLAAFSLGAFAVLTALLFHIDFGDQIQLVMFMKNVSMAGGFLLLAVHGAGRFSLDHQAAR